MILRAQVVLPVSAPPLRDGAVCIRGRRIEQTVRWRELSKAQKCQAIDLGSAVLMPGLVNAHCHLDYTHMAGQIPPPNLFSDWLKMIVSTKAGWTREDYAASWKAGAEMLVRSGTTTVADIEAVPELLPEMWRATPLRVISFLEMIEITRRREPRDVLEQTLHKVRSLRNGRSRAALSPHAPYSTLAELLQLTAAAARKRKLLLSIHLAESKLEFLMFTRGRGEMFDWLQHSGRDMSDCGIGSPVQQLHRAGVLGQNLIAVHVNYLGKGDAELLGNQQVNVVHCPRSHSYFGHSAFPLRRLARAGVNICLGTDSLATVYTPRKEPAQLDMFAEMRALGRTAPFLSPRTIVRMATVDGARALGMEGKLGQFSRGALADCIALPLPETMGNPYEAVLAHSGPVLASMIDGQWALPPACSETTGPTRPTRPTGPTRCVLTEPHTAV